MTVGIVGLGLIGGSLARAYAAAGHRVLGDDLDASVTAFAQLAGAIHGTLTEETLPECALLLLAVPPRAAADSLERHAAGLGKDTFVIDCCGTKREICAVGFRLAREHGFTFLGGHPMAGSHLSGFKNSRADLFRGAPMVLVPPVFDDMALLDRASGLLAPPGFGRFSVTTAEAHDRRIAFTSQLAHLVSNAYVKSPTALERKGFSAGSYKDLTRVARLDAPMWTELFLENRDFLTRELDGLIGELLRFRDCLQAGDAETLRRALEEGSRRKEEVG